MNDTLVLCYHAVSRRWDSDLAVTPEALEGQLTHLLSRGFTGYTFTDAVLSPHEGRKLAVTFDDGFRSVVELALPIMARLGLPGTLFVPSALVGREQPMSWPGVDHWLATRHRDELVGVSWDELQRLQDAGWEIGSHTRTHARLTDLTDRDLAQELRGSRHELEARLQTPCRSIAYPYGAADDRVAAAAAAAGYETACTLPQGFPPRPSDLLYPRVGVYSYDTAASFRRHTSATVRRLRASVLWKAISIGLPPIRRLQRRLLPKYKPGGASPALRFIAEQGTLIQRRPAVLAGGLLGRVGRFDALTIWPDAQGPVFVVHADHSQAAAWLLRTFAPRTRRVAQLDAAAWNALRARSLLSHPRGFPVLRAAAAGLGRELDRPRVAAYSPTGSPLAKVTCFVFERDAADPTVVVKAMPQVAHAPRLEAEVAFVEAVRERLAGAPAVAAALPLAPLSVERHGGEPLVVQPVDPLAASTGLASREEITGWLVRFQESTTDAQAAWEEQETVAALEMVSFAWDVVRPQTRERVLARVLIALRELDGVSAPRCAVHGDFWRGNVASQNGQLRVYDWEWSRLGGRPFLDLWTVELGSLREEAQNGIADGRLHKECHAALKRVEQDLATRGLDPRFALATMAPSVAELSFRVRRLVGRAGGNESGAMRIMAVVEGLLAG